MCLYGGHEHLQQTVETGVLIEMSESSWSGVTGLQGEHAQSHFSVRAKTGWGQVGGGKNFSADRSAVHSCARGVTAGTGRNC